MCVVWAFRICPDYSPRLGTRTDEKLCFLVWVLRDFLFSLYMGMPYLPDHLLFLRLIDQVLSILSAIAILHVLTTLDTAQYLVFRDTILAILAILHAESNKNNKQRPRIDVRTRCSICPSSLLLLYIIVYFLFGTIFFLSQLGTFFSGTFFLMELRCKRQARY